MSESAPFSGDSLLEVDSPLFRAMREIARASSSEEIAAAIHHHILPDVDRIAVTLQTDTSSDIMGVWDRNNYAPKIGLPDTIRRIVGDNPLIIPDISALDESLDLVKAYAEDALHAASLAVIPLTIRETRSGAIVAATRETHVYPDAQIRVLLLLAGQIGAALDNLALQSNLERQSTQVDLAAAAAQRLTGSADFETLGERLASGLDRLLPINHLSLAFYKEGSPENRLVTLHGPKMPEQIQFEGTGIGQALVSETALVFEDLDELTGGEFWLSKGIDKLVVVPLSAGDELLGTLNIGTERTKPLSAADVSACQHIGGYVAMAVDSILRIERLQATLSETATLYSTSLAINAARDLEEVFSTTLTEVAQLSDSDRIALYLAGPDPRETIEYIEMRAMWEQDQIRLENEPVRYTVAEAPILSQFPQSRSNLIFNEVTTDMRLDDHVRAAYAQAGVNSLLVLPLSTGAVWLGALMLEARKGQSFTNEQARMCRSLADQSALAMDSQMLMIRARQATERMREAVMQEQSLRDMAAALAATLNLDEVLDLILDNVGRVLPHDAANIQLVEGDVSRIVSISGYEKFNLSEEDMKALRLPIRETESLRTMSETHEPYLVADTQTAKSWRMIPETKWVRSNIGAPIFVGDELIGFLNIDSATPERYTADHAARLQVFANQAATAIRNARTYGTTRRQSELMGGVTSELQHATDVNEVMEATVRALDAAFQGYDIRLRLTAPQLRDDETPLIPPGDESEEKAGSA